VPLDERLPVYERYVPAELRSSDFDGEPADPPPGEHAVGGDEWIGERIRAAIAGDDPAGRLYRDVIAGTAAI